MKNLEKELVYTIEAKLYFDVTENIDLDDALELIRRYGEVTLTDVQLLPKSK